VALWIRRRLTRSLCPAAPTTHASEAELPPRTYPPEEDPSVGATADGSTTPHPSVPLETLPPTAPLSGASLSSSRNAIHTLIGVLGVVCIIALVIGFIWLRRRKAAAASASYDHDESAVSYHSDKFYQQADADATDDDDELGFARDARYSQRTTTVGMGYLSDVDLGRHAVRGEMRLGTNKLWRADYRGETVAAMQVNVESLRERDRDIEAVVASCVALRHPNVVEFLGTSMGTGEEMWLVAEYMTRGSLCSIMATSKLTDLTWETLHRLSLQLATALAFVQSMRDAMTSPRLPTLSSRSVLFDDELNCKLDVFEFAQSVRDDAQPVLSYGQGEIPYRAPELLRHALHSPTATSLQPLSMADVATAEVFALGAVLCELSLQSPLYSDITDTRGLAIGEIFIARQVAEGRLRPAPAADVPVDMARLLDACLAYEPAERPTIEQIVRQLVSMDVGN
jgi:serine/threonine protein kinase